MLGWLFLPFLSIIVLAAVVTAVFTPVFRFIKIKDRINAPFASFLTCIIIFFILFIPTIYFVGILSNEAYDLYLLGKNAVIGDQIKTLMDNNRILDRANIVLSRFNIEITLEELKDPISELIKIVSKFLYDQARSIASNVFSFFIDFFFMLIVCYYLFIDGERLVTFITKLSPLPNEQDEQLIQKFKDMSRAILIGNGLSGMIQGTLGGVVFFLFGIQAAFFWGVIMALFAFLPIVGVGIILIPAAIYLSLIGRLGAALFFLVFYLILSITIEYLFKPRLVGEQVKMHVLMVFFSIFGGLKLFGILGIIYGPLVVTAFLTLTEIYYSSYQRMVTPNR